METPASPVQEVSDPARGPETVTGEDRTRSFEILRLGARSVLNEQAWPQLRNLLLEDVNWPYVYAEARFHRVDQLLGKTLLSHFPESVPGDLSRVFEGRMKATALRSAFLIGELHRVTNLLQEDGIRSLPLKGAILSEMAYGDLRLRPFSDLDLVVRPDRFIAARDLLLNDRYEPFGSHALVRPAFRGLTMWLRRQFELKRGGGYFNLDLHAALMPPLYSFPISFDELYDRAEEIELGSELIRTFHPDDMLIILCFHGVKNQWRQLKHVCDIAEFVRRQSDLAWPMIVDNARRMRCTRIVYQGLYLARQMLDAPVLEQALTSLEHGAAHSAADRAIYRFAGRSVAPPPSVSDRFRDNLAVLDTPLHKARYIAVALVRRISALFEKDVTE